MITPIFTGINRVALVIAVSCFGGCSDHVYRERPETPPDTVVHAEAVDVDVRGAAVRGQISEAIPVHTDFAIVVPIRSSASPEFYILNVYQESNSDVIIGSTMLMRDPDSRPAGNLIEYKGRITKGLTSTGPLNMQIIGDGGAVVAELYGESVAK